MNKTNTNSLSQGQLVHALKRRVRIIAPVLQKDPERAYILGILLKIARWHPGCPHSARYCFCNN